MGRVGPIVVCGLMILAASGGCTTDEGPESTSLPSTTVPPSSTQSNVVTVPNGVGVTVASATKVMADRGLRVEAASAPPTEVVTSQRPEPGSRVAVGSTVTLEVSGIPGPGSPSSSGP